MFRHLARLYSRRIVNVNVNILVASILALGPTIIAVRLTYRWFGITDPDQLDHAQKLVITAVTFLTDVVFDVAIYFCLHWLANNLPRQLKMAEGVLDAEHVPFVKDATVVQLQRAVLSPVLYIGWLGTGYLLMNTFGWWSTLIGWCIGIGTARTLHTIWMIRAQRWARERISAAVNVVTTSLPQGSQTAAREPERPGSERQGAMRPAADSSTASANRG